MIIFLVDRIDFLRHRADWCINDVSRELLAVGARRVARTGIENHACLKRNRLSGFVLDIDRSGKRPSATVALTAGSDAAR